MPKLLKIDQLLNRLRSLLGVDVYPIFISAVRPIGGFHATSYPSPSAEAVQVGHYPPKVLTQLSKTDPISDKLR
ncbi:hypothetical protein [Nostoc sp.]|uniref:hypothetical protein n=1 Tax=Nostoc sp. TaxID=1180 RepID=UPI002FF5C49A